jgi:hypothetical protein
LLDIFSLLSYGIQINYLTLFLGCFFLRGIFS